MEALGFNLREEALLKTLTMDVIKTSEIEGELLEKEQVRSSIAQKLGMDIGGLSKVDRNTEGVVGMMMDATENFQLELSKQRLFAWHKGLFPKGPGTVSQITIGGWRKAGKGPMQVVSGPLHRQKVHFEAPDSSRLKNEMDRFLEWFNGPEAMDPILKSGLAHLWFITIHPFDDGNGRIARAISDLQLCRAEGSSQRFYSMSARIEQVRNTYYDLLERTQKGSMDISLWLNWYLETLAEALENSEDHLSQVLAKARFWQLHSEKKLNERQRFMINKLLDDFFGKLSSSKWAKMTKVSHDTALRDIKDLLTKEILIQEEGGGRSTRYQLNSYN